MAQQVPRFLADGRYELLEPLGSGGTATVFRGRDHTLQVDRAIKVLKSAVRKRPDLQVRMQTEARVLASLNHRGVVPIFDFGSDEDVDYLVCELVRGDTIHQRVKSSGALTPVRGVRIAIEVLEALHAVHARGVVHRDVKPSNILLDEFGAARLIDFGIARAPDSVRMTAVGAAMGTLAFMAPEQRIDASSVGPLADIHAVGTSLYWMISRLTPMDLGWAEPSDSRWRAIPGVLVPIIQRAIEYEPEDRYASAAEMASALRLALEELAPSEEAADAEAVSEGARAAYLEALPGSIAELKRAIDGSEERIRRLGANLERSATTHGFERVAAAAAAVRGAGSGSVREVAEELLSALDTALAEVEHPLRSLIVEPDSTLRSVLTNELGGLDHEVHAVRDASGALDFVSRFAPSVVVQSLELPDADGMVLLRSIRAIRPGAQVFAVANDRENLASCREVGITEFFVRPLGPGTVGRAVAAALGVEHEVEVRTVMVVEDDPVQARLLAKLLPGAGVDVVVFRTASELLAHDGPAPTLLLMDAGLPDMDGFALLERLKTKERYQDVPVIFVTARDSTEDLVRALEQGAEDYITKPYAAAELLARVQRVLRR